MRGAKFFHWLYKERMREQTRDYLSNLVHLPETAARERTEQLLARLRAEGDERVTLGYTPQEQAVELALPTLCTAHSIVTGASGGGKSRFILLLIAALLRCRSRSAFGLLDPKSETFLNTIYLIARLLDELPPAFAEALRERIVMIDLSLSDPICSYNICKLWDGADLDYFVASRMETLQELLPSDQGLSLRGGIVVRHLLKLLTETEVPFGWIDRVIDDEDLRNRLLARARNAETIAYFRHRFPEESKATISAVQSRLSSLMASESVRLALSGHDAPDFRRYQDEGLLVPINCGGPNIPRITQRVLQQLFLADIRQSVYARQNQHSYLWIADEAQNFFRTAQLRENFDELLRQARSFGTFFCAITQNLSTAVRDNDLLENLHTNCRWSLSLRGAPRDAHFLRDSLPVTGRMPKPSHNPFKEQEFYSLSEERAHRLAEIAHLPDRTGWFWVKSLSPEPILLTTANCNLPEASVRTRIINKLRLDPTFGRRVSRAEYLAQIEAQERALTGGEPTPASNTTLENLRRRYRARGKE